MNLSYSALISRAWPIILANASVPLLGLIDTAVIGNTGNAQSLGAIALGALIFSFVYWSFGFLRMSTTGFTAQAAGAQQSEEVRLILGRALLIGLVIGFTILLIHPAIVWAMLSLFQATEAVESLTRDYFVIRIWGAPAAFATFALMGTLIGLGKSKFLLIVQVFLNGLNAVLDIVFAGYLNMGVEGIALGTAIAEWATLILAGAIVIRVLHRQKNDDLKFWSWQKLIERQSLIRILNANRDIFIRTLLLVFCFAWFTNESAQFGDSFLAANHILLQFISFSAFFLDGYAFVAESIVGQALGAKQQRDFDLGVYRSSLLGVLTAFALGMTFFVFGDFFVSMLTNIEDVILVANQYLHLACIYIIFSVAAFQFDGIFIGAVRAAEMRNAAIVSGVFFVLLCEILTNQFDNPGLWWAFIIYVILRALCLLYYFPRIRRAI